MGTPSRKVSHQGVWSWCRQHWDLLLGSALARPQGLALPLRSRPHGASLCRARKCMSQKPRGRTTRESEVCSSLLPLLFLSAIQCRQSLTLGHSYQPCKTASDTLLGTSVPALRHHRQMHTWTYHLACEDFIFEIMIAKHGKARKLIILNLPE